MKPVIHLFRGSREAQLYTQERKNMGYDVSAFGIKQAAVGLGTHMLELHFPITIHDIEDVQRWLARITPQPKGL